MTIGLAAYGENAGRAILNALAAVEAIGIGAIGGFVSAVAIVGEHTIRAETQTGGSSGLQFFGPREAFENAGIAALISSGPNRPVPLSDLVLAAPGIGVVTGHRLPTAPGHGGVPMNREVLGRMAQGIPVQEAVASVISANPGADCGLAAIDAAGTAHVLQTTAAARPDAHMACAQRRGATICVLHNAIRPAAALAGLATEIALETLAPGLRAGPEVKLARGCPIRPGPRPVCVVDEAGRIVEIQTPDGRGEGYQVLNLGYRPSIVGSGNFRQVLAYEPFVEAQDGKVSLVDGAEAMMLPTGTPL